MVRRYCFLRLNLKTMVLASRSCSVMVPLTMVPAAAAPVFTCPSSTTASTRLNSTCEPTSPTTVSSCTVSPGVTRYCFPPFSITAYIRILFLLRIGSSPGPHTRYQWQGRKPELLVYYRKAEPGLPSPARTLGGWFAARKTHLGACQCRVSIGA